MIYYVLRHPGKPTQPWHWKLRYHNGKVHSVSSESYTKKSACLRSIEVAKRDSAAAEVIVQE